MKKSKGGALASLGTEEAVTEQALHKIALPKDELKLLKGLYLSDSPSGTPALV